MCGKGKMTEDDGGVRGRGKKGWKMIRGKGETAGKDMR
jgi:hypothetical protein